MNKTVNKAWDKFLPKLQTTRHREEIPKLKETGDLNYIYKSELDQACFYHDAAYSGSKDLTKGTISGKILIRLR